MELRQITTFIKVAQLQSFSRAAESLGYSQSAVTVQIRQLEEELDVRLFDRIHKGVVLTSQGKRFLDAAFDVVQAMNKAAMSVESTDDNLRGSLHVGTLESLCYTRMTEVARGLRTRYPGVSLQITTGTPEELIAKMERGEVDLIYILDEPLYNNRWNKLLEQREEVVLVASTPLAEKLGPGPHQLEDLIDLPFYLTEPNANYRLLLKRRLAALGKGITPVLETSYASFLIRVLEQTEAISFLPLYLVEEALCRGTLQVIEVEDFRPVMYGQIFHHKDRWATREMEVFVRLVSEIRFVCPANGKGRYVGLERPAGTR